MRNLLHVRQEDKLKSVQPQNAIQRTIAFSDFPLTETMPWRCPLAPRYALTLPRMERAILRNLSLRLAEDKKVLAVLVEACDESGDDPGAFHSLL